MCNSYRETKGRILHNTIEHGRLNRLDRSCTGLNLVEVGRFALATVLSSCTTQHVDRVRELYMCFQLADGLSAA